LFACETNGPPLCVVVVLPSDEDWTVGLVRAGGMLDVDVGGGLIVLGGDAVAAVPPTVMLPALQRRVVHGQTVTLIGTINPTCLTRYLRMKWSHLSGVGLSVAGIRER